jgi:hypothetical protein
MAGSGGWRSAFDDERVVLPCGSSSSIYGGTGPPLQRWRGCTVLVGTTACGHGKRDLEGGPLRRMTRASVMADSVLHPRQAAAYTRGLHGKDHQITKIQSYNASYDPLAYQLFFPRGEPRWHTDILKTKFRYEDVHAESARKKIKGFP